MNTQRLNKAASLTFVCLSHRFLVFVVVLVAVVAPRGADDHGVGARPCAHLLPQTRH